ncbi:MAG: transglutaminase family protein [Verrucomicrobiae bacterium]|nr:transglutaminase family protein [Verrucomicrobiae bacterium]
MAIHCALHHRTVYRYDRPVTLGPQVVRLRPAPHNRTPILSYSLKIGPQPHFLNWQQDPQGNFQARIVFPKPVKFFDITVDLTADLTSINPFDFFLDEHARTVPFEYDEWLTNELAPFRRLPAGEPGPLLKALVEESRPKPEEVTIDFLVRVNQLLEKKIDYLIRMEPGVQAPEETLEKGSGSCRDSAWLLVHVLRRLGFAARFVSGYLIQLKPDIKALDGPTGTDVDFTDLHAWADVYLPGAGWVGMDPTSGLMAGEGHIPLAATPDPPSAAPMTGYVMTEDVETEFEFDMKVERVHETARVTAPYTEEEWEAIDTLGKAVEARLESADVRLTMGGEPTFVSIDDMEGDEWNTAAMGPMKRGLADELLHRLKNRFAPGAFLHHGQGKWYPGEQLPRWAFSCHWRRDGIPAWEDPSLIADEKEDYGHTCKESGEFINRLAKKLGVGGKHIQAGYEDAWYYLWRERRLPANVDPFDSKLDDKIERERLARVFERKLDSEVGHVLPLSRGNSESGWVSGPWFFRPERLYLIPGDSPMGFRLPLESLPWTEEDLGWMTTPVDPTVSRDPFPRRRMQGLWTEPGRAFAADTPVIREQPRDGSGDERIGTGRDRKGDAKGAPGYQGSLPIPEWFGESMDGLVRTALCVEPREGKLNIFMPPLRAAEDYLELVAAIEDTASELGTPVMLEGYLPPRDPRLNHISVTPDPGVIEVNIHPAENWEQLKGVTRGIYEDARLTRLGTEKFRVDGTHTGTGGGNHIVVGGSTPSDSPFLRRPDLLRSLVAYWHNHPSLSYLFSGAFIGPTSQAPRVDEARNDSVYELDLAFRQLPKRDQAGGNPPWLVDRVLRNLLVDLTGNTHRAEFCIDKLYSPEGGAGRLGLLEMRGFEMPPHADMSLAQQLLVRASIARFWEDPYLADPVRWGTGLHDRFLLPHFIWDDFTDVLDDFNRGGFAFDPAWFEPHFEFRFPELGSVAPSGVKLEVRQAIEPWNVLGEEQTNSGTARYVDSSVERVQVLLQNLTDPRHVLSCNGRKVPLHPTGRNGEYVAGVRYRAWSPPSAMHPTIPVNSPLTFDLVDVWNERSIGGCEYHVAHPGGRSYEDFPVNSYAAESRRRTRFVPFGHTPGRVAPPTEVRSLEFPLTLDLQMPVRYAP